jgi:hypothetical protein
MAAPAVQSAVKPALSSEQVVEDPHVFDEDDGQVLETDAPATGDRTVFEDPKSFNLKVRP